MEKLEIVCNKPEEAIAIMKEVAKWGREQGYRVWPDEWLTPDELITEDAKPENFCIGKMDGKVVRKIFLNAGFKIMDIIDFDNGRSMALYEMEV